MSTENNVSNSLNSNVKPPGSGDCRCEFTAGDEDGCPEHPIPWHTKKPSHTNTAGQPVDGAE